MCRYTTVASLFVEGAKLGRFKRLESVTVWFLKIFYRMMVSTSEELYPFSKSFLRRMESRRAVALIFAWTAGEERLTDDILRY